MKMQTLIFLFSSFFFFFTTSSSSSPPPPPPPPPCFPSIFAFGASLIDTGNGVLSSPIFFTANNPPYGQTYFHRPAQRFSDGRLIIDFLAQALGLPFLNPYLKLRTGADVDFSGGVNYAVAGATALNVGYFVSKGILTVVTPLSLDEQLVWHLSLKANASSCSSSGYVLPRPGSFSKGLYFLQFGGNDYGAFITDKRLTPTEIKAQVVPLVIQKLTNAVELLYKNDARKFFFLNTIPQGCLPIYHVAASGAANDSNGCAADVNTIDQFHNSQLRLAIQALGAKYSDISIIYADAYAAYESILQHPSRFGIENTVDACCGAGPGSPYAFELMKLCNPTSYVCVKPSSFISWDGIHLTDAFSRQMVKKFVEGEAIDPHHALSACASPSPPPPFFHKH